MRSALALAPGRGPHGAHRGRQDGLRKLHAHHPIGIGDVHLEGRVVAVQRRLHLAQLILAFAGHRVVADAVDPSAADGAHAAAALGQKCPPRGAIVAVVE